MNNHIPNLTQVTGFKFNIKNRQNITAAIGIIGTDGHLNFLSKSGDFLRKTIIAIATNIKADNVPIFTISDKVSIETNPPNNAEIKPNIQVEIKGVSVLLLTFEKFQASVHL